MTLKHIKTGTSPKSKVYETTLNGITCIQKTFKEQEDYEREASIMRLLSGKRHFPTILKEEHKCIWISHNGNLLRNCNCPADYKKQLCAIFHTLNEHNIFHNDIWKNNMVVDSSGTITLIDFGWQTYDSPGHPHMNLTLEIIDKVHSIENLYDMLWAHRH